MASTDDEEQIKNFQAWHLLKERIHNKKQRLNGYKERDVWWVSMGHNIGVEQDGKGENFERPVLVVKGFNRELFWGIPLSTTERRSQFHFPFEVNGVTSVAILSQARAFDTMRLINKIGMISETDFNVLKEKVTELFGLKNSSPPPKQG